MDDGWWASDVLPPPTSSSSLIRIAVAKREDDDDDELRIRCRSAINRQNPPPIYRQLGAELTMLREGRGQATADEWTPGRVDYVDSPAPASCTYHRWHLSNLETVDDAVFSSLSLHTRTQLGLQYTYASRISYSSLIYSRHCLCSK